MSGGPDSGLYKSTDGGDTWTDISRRPGLPQGLLGKIGVALSPPQLDRVWATIEAADGGIFRSDDGGAHWQRVAAERTLWWRAPFYGHIFADPHDADTCYILSVDFWRSVDGGFNFTSRSLPHGDHHDLWIDPRDPRRMIEGNDGGATVTLNGGATWSTQYNQPTASFFHLAVDNQYPYRVYGTQNDNSAVSVPSRNNEGAIPWQDCYAVSSAESGHIAVRPDNPDIVYAGAIGSAPGGGGVLLRYDHGTGQTRIITAWPEVETYTAGKDQKYRFQFHFPTALSPHDPDTLYIAANVLFRSRTDGSSWEVISPDLTRRDLTKMTDPVGGPVAKASSAVSFNIGSILAFAESPHRAGVFWCGSDDGLVNISRNDGQTWTDITPAGLPEWANVSVIEPSPHDPAAAYLSAARWKLGDTRPYLFKTQDYGATWQEIITGIPEHDFVRVIRADPVTPGLLYAGSESGVYISFDDGGHWQPLQLNLPAVPVYDLVIKEGDLVAATHGRAFWILDDLTHLRQVKEGEVAGPVHLFRPRDAYRPFPRLRPPQPAGAGITYQRVNGGVVAQYTAPGGDDGEAAVYLDAGQNPPDGVIVRWYHDGAAPGEVALTFRDSGGDVIKTFTAAARPGMNRFIWDLCWPGEKGLISVPGPVAVPGAYTVSLEAGGQTLTESFQVKLDPRVKAGPEDLDAQFALLADIRDQVAAANRCIMSARRLRDQIAYWQERTAAPQGGARAGASAAAAAAAGQLADALWAIENQLISIPQANPQQPPPTRLAEKLAGLVPVVAGTDAAPTEQAAAVFSDVAARVDVQIEKLAGLIEADLDALNRSLAGQPPIVP
ncbi:MAG: hypothetical protein WD535_02205 [Thermaerobacterales bacterium]